MRPATHSTQSAARASLAHTNMFSRQRSRSHTHKTSGTCVSYSAKRQGQKQHTRGKRSVLRRRRRRRCTATSAPSSGRRTTAAPAAAGRSASRLRRHAGVGARATRHVGPVLRERGEMRVDVALLLGVPRRRPLLAARDARKGHVGAHGRSAGGGRGALQDRHAAGRARRGRRRTHHVRRPERLAHPVASAATAATPGGRTATATSTVALADGAVQRRSSSVAVRRG